MIALCGLLGHFHEAHNGVFGDDALLKRTIQVECTDADYRNDHDAA